MYRMLLSTVALLSFAVLSPAGSAQGQWDRGGNSYGGPGTYQDTCTDAHWDGSVLYARCQREDGSWHTTSIDSRNCGGQILNLNGNLRCGQATNGYYQQGPNPPAYGGYNNGPYNNGPYNNQGYNGAYPQGNWQGGLPPGDYQLTCQNIHVDGDNLRATCQKRDGGWRNTHMDFDHCNSPIVNDNGHLRCQRW